MTIKEFIQLVLALTIAAIYKINSNIEMKKYEEDMKKQGKTPL